MDSALLLRPEGNELRTWKTRSNSGFEENLRSVHGRWVSVAMSLVHASIPWEVASAQGEVADAIAWAATQDPLFAGEEGATRTAALLVALAHHASGFQKTRVVRRHGKAWCGLYAIPQRPGVLTLEDVNHGSRMQYSDVTLVMPRSASLVALDLCRTSFERLHERPLPDRLALYPGIDDHSRTAVSATKGVQTGSQAVLYEAAQILLHTPGSSR